LVHLILGGARSGKSAYAERLAQGCESQGAKVFYIATAQVAKSLPQVETSEDGSFDSVVDEEMVSRIARHQADRPSHWQTVECPVHLAKTLADLNDASHCILVDCLTLWTLNLIERNDLQTEKEALLTLLKTLEAEVVLVSNEVGLGIIPMGKLTRNFVDELGWLHQDVAKLADEVTFVTAGLPMKLKTK